MASAFPKTSGFGQRDLLQIVIGESSTCAQCQRRVFGQAVHGRRQEAVQASGAQARRRKRIVPTK
jgi:hypothetical protein